ncbi:membrane protein [Spirochaetia bacterium]|nr:membrane protein [Spirochaetia bacterium]
MQKHIRFISVLALSILALAACSGKGGNSGGASASGRAADSGPAKMAVVLGRNSDIDDRSFTQGAWEGMKKFSADNNMPCTYFKAAEDSISSQVDALELAVNSGAEILVMPGFPWGNAVYIGQERFPDVKMVVLDDEPHTPDYKTYAMGKNTHTIYFAENESGFLAGYAAVKEGLRNMGFLGGQAVPSVIRFGYGFIYGADLAAQELGLAPGSVTIKYHYVGNFDPSPENQTFAASWYSSGTEAIFAAAGGVGNVVMAAAQQTGVGKIVIGVDVDQSGESPTVLTSAMKNLRTATYRALQEWKDGTFPGGTKVMLTAKEDGVGLPLEGDSFRFKKFTKAEYDTLFKRLVTNEGGLADNVPHNNDYKAANEIPTKVVKVSVM